MKPTKIWVGLGAAAISGSLLLGTTMSQASSIEDSPTLQEAKEANSLVKDYLDSLDDTPVTPSPTPTSSSTPTSSPTVVTPPQENSPTLVVTPGNEILTLNWVKPRDGNPTGYRYGRDGVDKTGYGAFTSETLPTTQLAASLDKLVNGQSYRVFVEAVYSDGTSERTSAEATPVGAPVVTPTGTTSPSPSVTPSAGTTGRLSGMPYSSGVWANSDRARTAQFVAGPRQGVPLDNQLVYTSRNSMASQNNAAEWRSQLPTNYTGVNHDFVLALTTWTSDGASMTAAQASAIGDSICAVDPTSPIVRLDWEMNLQDGAGVNGAVLTASNYSAWVQRFRTVATALKAKSCGIRIDFNPNVGTDQTTGCNSGTYAAPNNCSRRAFQELKDVIDIFGLDTYDSWPPVTSSGSGWSARSDASRFGSLENSRLYAKANGKKFSIPEWGLGCNTSGCQWAGNAGGDDPEYMKRMIAYFAANAGDIAYETYFDEDDGYILSTIIDQNPNSRAQYRTFILATR
jgi:hypothetical protein